MVVGSDHGDPGWSVHGMVRDRTVKGKTMMQKEFNARSAFMLWMVGAILFIGACL